MLTVGGFGLCVLGVVIVVFTSAGSFSGCDPDCTVSSGSIIGIILGYSVFVGGWVMQIVAWIGSLIAQAKRQQWAWFVCTIMFGVFCLWIYLLAVKETPEPVAQISRPYPPAQVFSHICRASHIRSIRPNIRLNQSRRGSLNSRKNSPLRLFSASDPSWENVVLPDDITRLLPGNG